MRPLARPAIHAACFALLVLFIAPASPLWLWGVEAVALAGLATMRFGRLRPWSDLVAWAGTLVALAQVPGEGLSPLAVAALCGACIAFLAVLHRPPAGVPRTRPGRALAVWSGAAVAAFGLAWWPALASRGQAVAVQDPQSAAGAALRIIGLILLVFLAIGGSMARARLRWRREQRADEAANGIAAKPG